MLKEKKTIKALKKMSWEVRGHCFLLICKENCMTFHRKIMSKVTLKNAHISPYDNLAGGYRSIKMIIFDENF